MGLAHGRLGPGHVLLAGLVEPKLDFTGAAVGFPGEPELARSGEGAPEIADGANVIVSPPADLYSLGALLAWLLLGRNIRADQKPSAEDLAGASSLGDLVRDLFADDPSERPTAHEVQERLNELLSPMDATGNWVMPSAGLSQSSLLAQSARAESVADGFGAGTIILDKGVPRLGRYRLLEKLGEGGQGVVHRGGPVRWLHRCD